MSDLSRRIAALSPEKQALLEERLRARGLRLPEAGTIPRRSNLQEYPLSFSQERILIDDSLSGVAARYNESRVFHLAGSLAYAVLEQSLTEVVRRHEVLRSRFEIRDGLPIQAVDPPRTFELPITDLREYAPAAQDERVRSICHAEATTSMSLAAGPLIRARLLRIAENEHLLIITLHHIVCDGWSLRVFFAEAATLYAAFSTGRGSPLPDLPIQYADYADWQRRQLEGEVWQKQIAYWSEQLTSGDPPAAQLIHDRVRSPHATFEGQRQYFTIPQAVTAALKQLAHEAGATPFVAYLTALKALLARYAGHSDIVVGTLHANREREELAPLIGFFVNTLVLRTDLSADPTFREAVARVRDVTFRAYAHQDLPYDRLVKELQPRRTMHAGPFFQVEFLYDAPAPPEPHVAGLKITSRENYNQTAKFDLVVDLRERTQGGVEGFLEYSTEVFDAATMDRFAAQLAMLLQSAAGSPDARISELSLMTEDDHALLAAWNATERTYPATCMHRLIEAQADRTPDGEAVVFAGQSLSFRELDQRANRLAHHLREMGVALDTRVGIALDRSLDLIVALLAVHKAGAAYVPVDPSYPHERLAVILGIAALDALVTDEPTSKRLPASSAPMILIDRDAAAIAARPANRPNVAVDPENLAYAIFTSGSTGTPKGVMISHQALANHMLWMQSAYRLTPADRFLHKTPLGFDVSAFEIFWPLMSGATLVLAVPGGQRDAEYLVRAIQSDRITAIYFVASMLQAFLDTGGVERCTTLRLLFSGGEALPISTHDRVFERFPGIALHNLYGPTEATIDVTAWLCERNRTYGSVPIGRPVHNTRIHILDAQMRPVPIGAIGYLYIAGVHLARGYLARPDLTAACFLPDPFALTEGARLYASGDLARYRNDGSIQFFGRGDHQVKIRGNRIEIGEIEQGLRTHDTVRDAVVVVHGKESRNPRLAAYVVSRDASLTAADMRTHLKRKLPDAMIPSWFVFIDSIPRTPNGKVDRRALPSPQAADEVSERASSAPSTEIERTLLSIWSNVLGTTSLGVQDNFFEVGGDSILALQIVSRANQAGLHLSLQDIFSYQSVAALAAASGSRLQTVAACEVGPDSAPVTPIQRWFFEQHPQAGDRYNQAVCVVLRREVNVAHLAAALEAVWNHHDALHTRFVFADGSWRQYSASPDSCAGLLDTAYLDRLTPEERATAFATYVEDTQTLISLPDQRLFSACVFDLGVAGMRLLLVAHHLVVDGVSWRIILEDLETAYRQLEAGESVALPQNTCSFLRWAELLEIYARSPQVLAEVDYWAARVALPLALPRRQGENTWRASRVVDITCSREETDALAHEVPARTGATVQEVLIVALARALQRYTGAAGGSLMMEGHGRESVVADVDVSRTVGWFTTLYPFTYEFSAAASLTDILWAVKTQLREIPNHGIGYGLLRYSSDERAALLRDMPLPEVSFNYLGRLDNVFVGSMFEPADEDSGVAHALDARRPFLLEIDAAIVDSRLRIRATYSDAVHDYEHIAALMEQLRLALRELIVDAALPTSPAAFGFEDTQLSQADLDQILLDAPDAVDIYPLSATQHGFLFHTLLDPTSGIYIEQLHCRLEGDLDRAAFAEAWHRVIRRHAALRTSFRWEVDQGRPLQIVHAQSDLVCAYHDLRDQTASEQERWFADYLSQDRRRGFDLTRLPLMRLAVFRVAERAYRLLWTHHHIVMDGWCMPVLLNEAFIQYEAARAGRYIELPTPRPYRDFIAWLERQDLASAESFWRNELAGTGGATRLRMPRPPVPGGPGKARVSLNHDETSGLLQFARRSQLTLNTLLQGAWALVLSRFAGDTDVLFGATVAGRPPDLGGVEEIIGVCINTLPVRVRLDGNPPVIEWLRELQRRQIAARAFDFTPLAQISRWLDLPQGKGFFESIVVFENYPVGDVLSSERGGLRIYDAEAIEQTNYPLTLIVVPGTSLELIMLFDGVSCDERAASQLLGHVRTALLGLVEQAGARLADISIVDHLEQQQSLRFAQGTLPVGYNSGLLQQGFEIQAARQPHATAVVCGNAKITYGELDRHANSLARYLTRLGVRRGTLVGLYLGRSLEMIVAMLGTLKAGGAYVPMDPTYPVERVAKTLEDSAALVLLTDSSVAAQLPSHGAHVVYLDTDWEQIAREPSAAVDCPALPPDPAYVMYTSGSTGRPKGVVVCHANVVDHFAPAEQLYRCDSRDVWTVFHSYSFDFSIWEIWGALSHGSRLVIVPLSTARSPEEFYELLARERVTILTQTPSYFQQLLAHTLTREDTHRLALRLVFLGGEALDFASLAPWFERFGDSRPAFVNVYGPTEATVAVTHRRVTAGCAQELIGSFLGKPLGGNCVYVLDEQMRPVAVGMCGEAYAGGTGVSDGYFRRPHLTAEKFVPDPFGGAPGARLYRTGDRVRWTPDGELEYLGRIDHQIKIRGFRVELGEIEAMLRNHERVHEAVVVAFGDGSGDRRLVAYVVPAERTEVHGPELRAFLRRALPEYMVPHIFVPMASLPLSPSGKVDRLALPQPSEQRPESQRPWAGPTTEWQRVLVDVWETVLGVAPVGIDDNFFELGGDSIRSIQIAALARRRGVDVSLADLFARPTIRQLACTPEGVGAPREHAPTLPFSLLTEAQQRGLPDGLDDAYPITALQMGMLFHGEDLPDEGLYHDVMSIDLEIAFEEYAIVQAVQDVIAAHPVLRSSFDLSHSPEPLQLVHRGVSAPLSIHDWKLLSGAEQTARLAAHMEQARQLRFDASHAPLWRVDIIRLTEHAMRLILCSHHAILDGWSIATLLTELITRYAAASRGLPGAEHVGPSVAGMREFVRLEREALSSDTTRQFWQAQLAGADAPLLPRDSSLPAGAHARVELPVPQDLRSALQQISSIIGVPLKSVFLAAHIVTLQLVTGSNNILTGLVSNGRPEVEDGDRVLGLFLNVLPFYIRGRGITWADLLHDVFEHEGRLVPHRHLPLVETLRPYRLQLETAFNYVDFHIYERLREIGGIKILNVDAVERTNFALEIGVTPTTLEIHTRGLDDSWGERIAGYFMRALQRIAHDPHGPLVVEALLPEDEWHALVPAQSDTRTSRTLKDVIHAFQAQALRTPDAVAVIADTSALTYAELDVLSSRLAARLRSHGVRQHDLVGLICDRTPNAVVGILGILKAGAAYVPIDRSYPQERIAVILEEAQPSAILTDALRGDPLPGAAVIPCLSIAVDDSVGEADREPVACSPDGLAYVMYTSGSTGNPKGVMITRGGLARVTDFHITEFGLASGSRVLQFASLSFDSSIPEIFGVLCSGATMCIVPDEARAGPPLVDFLERYGVTHATLPPSILTATEPSTLPSLRMIGSAGEACTAHVVRRWAAGRRFLNLYGPTENTVDATFAECVPDGSTPLLGRPLPDVHVYLLGPGQRLVPRGVVGELYVGGSQIACGYLHRPDLTAERFLPDRWSGQPGARLYRTGDLARYEDDGSLSWVGRVDHQVKLNGVRVELGEIECVLARHPAVRDCAVVVAGGTSRQALIAYIVCSAHAAVDDTDLKAFLGRTLPAYMVPSTFVALEALPLTPNGKVDRAALECADVPLMQGGYVVPVGPEQEALAAIWKSVLSLPQVGAHDDFFEIGGSSLTAMQVVARIRAVLNVEISVRALFEERTIAALASHLVAGGDGPALPSITLEPRDRPIALSYAQERLWILHGLEPSGSTYNVPSAVRLSGQLDPAALERALQALVRRHEVLRTTFAVQDGRPVQLIGPAANVVLRREATTRRELSARLEAESALAFDLARGPLLRATLYTLEPTEHVLLVVMHHIVCDGWSTEIVIRELRALYDSFIHGLEPTLPPLPVQYADYAAWQRRHVHDEMLAEHLAYYKRALEDAPKILDLPTDYPRMAWPELRGARLVFTIDPWLRRAVEDLGRREGTTPFMTLLASFAILLARYAGVKDLLIGSPVANRPRSELEGLIGFFVNTLVLRVRTVGRARDVLAQVKQSVLDGFVHQALPFEYLVETMVVERDLARPPLVQVMFTMQRGSSTIPISSGLNMEAVDVDFGTAKFDITLNVAEENDGWRAVLEYNAALFAADTVERMASHFTHLLTTMTDSPERLVSDLPLLDDQERRRLLQAWNATATDYPRDATVATLFEAAVDRFSGRVALSMAGRTMSFAELDARANNLAWRLCAAGVGPGIGVGICLPRSFDLVVALIATLKAGGYYVPVERESPRERLETIGVDAQVHVWVVDDQTTLGLPIGEAIMLGPDEDSGESSRRLACRVQAEDPAYVMFTSGSTGRPKGVCVPHRAIVRLVFGQTFCRFQADETFLQLAPVSFDAATLEVWGPLLHGARLAIAPPGPIGIDELGAVLRMEAVTTLWLTAGLFHQVVDDRIEILAGVKTLLSGGDVVSPARVNRVLRELPGCVFVNGYGPTENTTFTTCHRVDREIADGFKLPIGRPIANTRVYVLDERLDPVPVGVWGELYAAGDGVALGYVANPIQTARLFVPDPFAAESGARMYRTGDFARWMPDGWLEFLGRRDDQVKIRGYRVELAEVEAVLRRHPQVRDCAVLLRKDGEDKQLVAYVVLAAPAPGVDELRAHLGAFLPAYMIPAAFMPLDRIPLGGTGKVDRAALPALTTERREPARPPRDETEAMLVDLWCEVLNVATVDPTDNFFELGGHSLRAAQLVSRIREVFHKELPLREIFETQRLDALAARLRTLTPQPPQPRISADSSVPAPLTFAQERLWTFERLSPGTATYNVPVLARLRGPLNADALVQSVHELVRRHEVLRINVQTRAGMPVQIVQRQTIAVQQVDLSSQPAAERESIALRDADRQAHQPFDLQRDALIRATVWRLAEDDHVLLICLHHIVCDGWSISIMLDELAALYAAFAGGRTPAMPVLRIQYADYARWQRQHLQGDLLDRQLAYWRTVLADAPLRVDLPTDRPRMRNLTFAGAELSKNVPDAVREAVESLAHHEGCTAYMVLLAAFQAWLTRYTGQEDILVGSPVSNRPMPELETLIGFFVNTVALRTDTSGNPRFRALVGRVKHVVLEAFAHQDVLFEQIINDLKIGDAQGNAPLLNVMFVVQSSPAATSRLHDVLFEPITSETTAAKFDLTLTLSDGPVGMVATLVYRTELFTHATVDRMARHFLHFLSATVQRPDQRIYDLPMMDEAEELDVLDLGANP